MNYTKVVIMLLCVMYAIQSVACDACGCAVGQLNGVLPFETRTFVGWRNHYSRFHIMPHSNEQGAYQQYFRSDLWFRFSLNRRIQFELMLPFEKQIMRFDDGQTAHVSGLSDVQMHVRYAILHNLGNSQYKHNLQSTLGVGLPSKLHIQERGTLPIAMQLGSSSLDVYGGLNYALARKNNLLLLQSTYVLRTKAIRRSFQRGDVLQLGASLAHKFRLSEGVTLQPFVGGSADYVAKDTNNGNLSSQSGGSTLWGTLGFNLNTQLGVLNLQYLQPLSALQVNGKVSPSPQWNMALAIPISKINNNNL